MPLVPSLSILMKQANNPLLKKSLAQIREQVNEGKSLDGKHVQFPSNFSAFLLEHGQGRRSFGNNQSGFGAACRFQ
jgi:type II secretory pathway component PulF